MNSFREVADGVHVLRFPVLDVNCTLIVGTERALLVDTLSCPSQAALLADAVRQVTALPIVVANTHYHFDHTFGNATIAELLDVADFWAHSTVIEELANRAGEIRAGAHRTCLSLAPGIADEVRDVEVLVPNRAVETTVEIELGGRSITLWHPGVAHSPGDLVILAGDVLVAGDLIEEGAPPNIHGADLDNWPKVIDALLPKMTGQVIPGHGAIVDARFAARQREELAALSGTAS